MHETFESKRKKASVILDIPPETIPRHTAIIMDGNGRWATERGLPRFEGHRQGGKTVESVVLHAVSLGIECMTLYSFSMQNWKRPADEIDYLMHLYCRYLEEIRPTLNQHNVSLVHLGRRDPLPQKVLDALDETSKLTSENSGMKLGLALNYGARDEIVDAAKKIARDCVDGKLNIDQIDEKSISERLYTANLPDPDLIIRTSGEMRISNFLLWQISYAEFYVTKTYWPDFDTKELDKAVTAYAKRARRFGDVSAKPQTPIC